MTGSDRKRFVIIDGKSVFYRGYYAMPNLATKDGKPTGGVFGFATMALEVLRRLKPDYVAVAWDKPKTNIRKRLAMYPEYKAGRKPAPPDFYEQVPLLHELLEAFGWPLYELDDYEADDIMGTLAKQAASQNIETLLITSDLDMLQLVNDDIHVYALKTGLSNIELYSPKSFEAKYGISVHQFLDLKALKGDSSDNIPGVPGIGEKGALDLLKQYQTLDNVYENLSLIKEGVRKKLEAGKDLAYLSKELARIWTDAPIQLDLSRVDGHHAKPELIMELLQSLEFRSLARHLPEIMQVNPGSVPMNTKVQVAVGSSEIIDTEDKLAALNFANRGAAFVLARSAGKHGHEPQIITISFDDLKTFIIDVRQLHLEQVARKLEELDLVVGYDLKAVFKVFRAVGCTNLPKPAYDVFVGAFLIDSLRREQTLSELAQADLGYEGSTFEDIDTDEFISRAAETIGIIRALYQAQSSQLQDMPKVAELATSIEWPVIPVLADMEYEGIELNATYLRSFSEEVDDMISDYEQQIYGYADEAFNIASPSQLAEVLFDKLKLPTQGIKKGKTGYSTAATELDKLRDQHPIIDLITQYREVAKLKNTYIDTLPKQVDEYSRIHTTYNLTIAQTGRLSSTDPNLQNIPTRTDLGKRIRTAFIAGPGKRLVSADYSQFELRLAAVLAGDQELIDMFNQGADIHTATAAQVYGRQLEDVTKQMRRAAKVINFGILYGMSPHGLSVAASMTRDQAAEFIDRYKALRQPLFDYMDRIRNEAREKGYVETLFGRRRPMPDIHSSNFVVRQAAERAAINMPIQGTEADLMKLAMVQVANKLAAEYPESRMLLQVHDSILVECPEKDAKAVADLLVHTMETVYKLPVRLDVDVTAGDNWGEL